MTVQGTVQDIYWRNLPVGDEKFVRPYGRTLVRLPQSLLAKLDDFPLEIEFQDPTVTAGVTLALEEDSPEIIAGEIEMAIGHWLDCFDLEFDLQQLQVEYDKEIFLELIELDLAIEESQLIYGINLEPEEFGLVIEGPDTYVSISISASLDAFDLVIDLIQPESITVNTAMTFLESVFDFEIDILEHAFQSNKGFTAETFSLAIDLHATSLLYGTTLILEEESTLEIEAEDHQTQWGTELNIDYGETEFGDLTLHYKTIIVASDAKFANTTGPNGSAIIYGTDEFDHSPFSPTFEYWDFKVRTSTVSHKRGNNVNLVHLGPVKPDMVMMHKEFAFVPNPGPNMLAGEWQYKSGEGYLSIINVDAIDIAVISDGSLDNVLTHWWPLDDTLNDSVGDIDLSYEITEAYVTGKHGKAWYHNGNNSIYNESVAPSLSGDFSYCVWWRHPGPSFSGLGGLISVYHSGGDYAILENNYIFTSKCSVSFRMSGGTVEQALTSELYDNEWHLAIITRESGFARLYIDGTLRDAGNVGEMADSGDQSIYIGATGGLFIWDGETDSIGWWDNHVLSQDEIDFLWSSGAGKPHPFDGGRSEYDITVSSGNQEETIILTDIDNSEEI